MWDSFKKFLARSSPTDWIQAVFGIPAFIVAVFALFSAQEASTGVEAATAQAENATTEAKKATTEASKSLEIVDRLDLVSPENTGIVENTNLLVLQIASYRIENCAVAQREIDSYGEEFGKVPTLWKSPSGAYAVVGIQASSDADAQQLKERAAALDNDPRFAQEDLENARIRVNPDWEPIANCQSVS